MVARILREAKAKGYHSFKAFETDSYEAGYQDFSTDFRAEFKKRRGYDCLAWLPAWTNEKLVIAGEELTGRFRQDMRQTISDLLTDRFYGELRRLADANKMTWMTEPYWGMALDWRTTGSRSTMPGCEFWVAPSTSTANPSYLIGAAPDIAALYGLPVVWAESFTAESFNSAWRNDPYFLKPWGDIAFCKGINQFFMHGFTHNPFDDRYQPGVSMGIWGTQMTRHATWWPYALPWHTYLARCQFMLRQGRPVNDVLSYPSRIEGVSGPVVNSGEYRQVVLNDESLFTRISVINGRIVVKGGGDFAALALAPWTAFKPEALGRIRDLVKDGATLIAGRPPAKSPSMQNYPASDSEVAALITEIWGPDGSPNELALGKGKVINNGNVAEAMSKITAPDVRFTSANPESLKGVDFVHRRDGDTEIYFICNPGNKAVDITADFRVSGKVAEQWDAVSGTTLAITNAQQKGGRTLVPVHFEPRQSFFVVFKNAASPQVIANLTAAKHTTVAPITGSWDIAFDTKWGGPAKIKFDTLQDWSKRPEEGVKYYSGTAVYSKNFDVPASALKNKALYINLGEVQNIARVNLNGKDMGIIWCAPWQAAIPQGLLKKKGNKLTIQVVNTWANRLVGDEQKPDDAELVAWNPPGDRKGSYDKSVGSRHLKDLPDWLVRGTERPATGRYTFSTWRFYNKEAPLIPAGLLGPVTITAATE
ncbi:MAG: glycosyl hydrolase [Mucilaginibacter sp.]